MSEPTRSCAGCGRKAPKSELIRFVSSNGALVQSDRGPGRGVYTCKRLSCFERAASRRAFARALRTGVRVDPMLSRIYTEVRRNG
jgi:uncharacterized protein